MNALPEVVAQIGADCVVLPTLGTHAGGVFALEEIHAGEYVAVYAGRLVTHKTRFVLEGMRFVEPALADHAYAALVQEDAAGGNCTCVAVRSPAYAIDGKDCGTFVTFVLQAKRFIAHGERVTADAPRI